MGRYNDIESLERRYWKIIRVAHDPEVKEFIDQCRSRTVEVDGSPYKYYECGSGPTVLFVHGLHTNLGNMLPVARELVERNYRVVLFDLPAHGEAPGSAVTPVEVREVIRAVGARLGELHAIVAYSVGALWAFGAWNDDLRAEAFVSIAAPCSHKYVIEKFGELHEVDTHLVEELFSRIERLLGPGVWTEFSPQEIVKTIDVPGLVIHGTSDDFIPPEHAVDLHSNWPGSTLELVEGTGHFDIVGSCDTRRLIAAYLHEVKSS
ncbi:alpha/beta fold hydrolase [Nocardia alni]|uniref:alpha/beta fold hydrolase n=1 Tax=Nocardia alni TaxID=2815723 RepID=UPI001C248C1C|nr:alpha/beta hydrolase [Nocardia alni]